MSESSVQTKPQLSVLTREEVSPDNQAVFDKIKGAIGMVPNLYATMAHSETALTNFLALQNAKIAFSPKEREVINLVVSQVNGCVYCQAAHTAIGKMNGYSEEETLSLRNGEASWDTKTDALAKLAKAIAETKGKNVTQEVERFFETGHSKGQLVDLVIAVNEISITNYLHNITQVPIDFPLAKEL